MCNAEMIYFGSWKLSIMVFVSCGWCVSQRWYIGSGRSGHIVAWMAASKSKAKKEVKKFPEVKRRPAARKRSGKPNWDSWNKKRRTLARANARRRQGLPLTRIHGKQKPKSVRKTRVVQRAVRADWAENDRGTESRSVQTDYQFFSLAELSDSPWEESEAESRFTDDVTYLDTEDSSADGYWSDKAWSV